MRVVAAPTKYPDELRERATRMAVELRQVKLSPAQVRDLLGDADERPVLRLVNGQA
jgi:hypothetical protein